MSSDGTIEAIPVRAEACAEFRELGSDVPVCVCGWLEHDHGELADRRRRTRLRTRVAVPRPARRAS
jgi:hypothetical protein